MRYTNPYVAVNNALRVQFPGSRNISQDMACIYVIIYVRLVIDLMCTIHEPEYTPRRFTVTSV